MFSFLTSNCSNTSISSMTPESEVSSVYLTANILLAMAMVIPHTSSVTAVLVRMIFSMAHLTYSAWAYSDLCSIPFFCWHSVLALVSIAKFSEVGIFNNNFHFKRII